MSSNVWPPSVNAQTPPRADEHWFQAICLHSWRRFTGSRFRNGSRISGQTLPDDLGYWSEPGEVRGPAARVHGQAYADLAW